MVRVLLTAFGPYGPWQENASWLALQALMRDAPADFSLTTRRYPVDFHSVRERLAADLVTPFDAVLHVGQSPGSSVIQLEGVGLNIAREIDQTVDQARELEPSGPTAYRSSLPLSDWADMLCHEGIPTRVSLHAGDFLCNAALYWSHYFSEQSDLRPNVAFVHVPLDISQAAEAQVSGRKQDYASMPAEICGFALRRILESLPSLNLENEAHIARGEA